MALDVFGVALLGFGAIFSKWLWSVLFCSFFFHRFPVWTRFTTQFRLKKKEIAFLSTA